MHSTTHMSRFVLLSVTLHTVVLAVLGQGTMLPQFPAQALSITLNKPSKVIDRSVHIIKYHVSRANNYSKTSNNNSTISPHLKSSISQLQGISQTISSTMITQAFNSDSDAPGQAVGIESEPISYPTEQFLDNLFSVSVDETNKNVTVNDSLSSVQTSNTASTTSRLAEQLRLAFTPYFSYPLLARRNGWEGQVEIGLRVESDGRLSHVHIARSSGYRLLDSTALSTLSNLSTLPKAADWLNGRFFDIVLPIEYKLIDNQS
jgi:TonB family protein